LTGSLNGYFFFRLALRVDFRPDFRLDFCAEVSWAAASDVALAVAPASPFCFAHRAF
jgi:hypothetical protein